MYRRIVLLLPLLALICPAVAQNSEAPTFGFQVFDNTPSPGGFSLGGVAFKSTATLAVDDVLARKGKALTKQGAAQLQRLAGVILVGRNVQSVQLIGYTDSLGSEEKNLKRGQTYANTIRASLFHNGVPLDLIKATSQGEAKPVASNLESEGRSRNRRVELIISGLREPQLAAIISGKEEAESRGAYIAADAVERITLASKSLFKKNTAKVNGSGEFALEQLANKLRDAPGWSELIIIGHSKNDSDTAQRMSKFQANAVLEYLVDHGIDTRNALALGLGNAVPVTRKKNDPRNERVVIEIHRD